MIHAENLYKSYPGNQANAVSQLNLNIEEGEFYGLLGSNGAGKTTTINMLCGILKPDSGHIRINGKKLPSQLEEIKRTIGVVPQDLAIYPSLNSFENLSFIGKMYDIPRSQLEDKIQYYIDLLGMREYAQRKASTYSGGMKRKLNLIAGILHQPKVIFLDEPTVGIDIQSKKLIIDLLKQLHKSGVTLIYTSHNMEEAELLCTKVGILNLGKLVLEGSPAELTALNPRFHKLENLLLHLADHGQITMEAR